MAGQITDLQELQMISKGLHQHYEEQLEYVEIDLRSSKHKNRLVEFVEKRNQLTNEFEYEVRAEWTAAKYHPNMVMTEDELLDFAQVINSWADKIRKTREQLG